ncbi:unnamed protein product [Lactuca saligna]|uniref:Uncharacterized protein n=1 Tax=Lactuca saligna TaxID=75948 RepID=A0AA35VI16_LACSI|nr:unnamed protein product [Lactuca saligna]
MRRRRHILWCFTGDQRMTITAVTIVDDSGGSSLLVGTCRSVTENHKPSDINRGSETENVDLESFGSYISNGSGWPVVGGGNNRGVVVVGGRWWYGWCVLQVW